MAADHLPCQRRRRYSSSVAKPLKGAWMLTAVWLSAHGPGPCQGQISIAEGFVNVPADNVTTGVAYMTRDNYPVASKFTRVLIGAQTLCGINMINDRVENEKAAFDIFNFTFGGAGLTYRFPQYEAHPSQTPGLEDWTCVKYQLDTFQSKVFEYNVGSIKSYYTNAQLATFNNAIAIQFNQLGRSVRTFYNYARDVGQINKTRTEAGLPINSTEVDTADVLSTIEITGQNLTPFTFDKQMVFLQSLFDSANNASVPMGLMNFSDWQAAQAAPDLSGSARRMARRLLQDSAATQRIKVDLWTQVIPPFNRFITNSTEGGVLFANQTMAQLWASTYSGIRNLTNTRGFPMSATFSNATVISRLANATQAFVTTEDASPVPPSSDVGSITGGSGGGSTLSSGAIAGITIGIAAATFAALFAAWVLLLRCSAAKKAKLAEQLARDKGFAGFKGEYASEKSFSEVFPDNAQIESSNDSLTTTATPASSKTGELSASSSGEGPYYKSIPHEEISILMNPDGSPRQLGKGNFGQVVAGKWRGSLVAIKILPTVNEEEYAMALQQEAAILYSVANHRNVVQFFGFSGKGIVTELMEGGDLRAALKAHSPEYTWERRGKAVALDVARGLLFLHNCGVIHRDIKSSNILLSKEGVAKIADVGLAIAAEYFSVGSTGGTWSYAAPELLGAGLTSRCTPAVDIYSFGVLLHEIITHDAPVRGNLRQVQPEECPPEVHQLLDSCIHTHVAGRPTAAAIVDVLEALSSPEEERSS
mmetsp:Transcript_9435/g.28385  ORF Transcript_9435/g.28385 Transcript_9435/m.28385 type:complete len:761 (-) Transcript_9435:1123-3405(-)